MLESGDLLISHCISLSNNWNQVDLRVQSAHDLNVKWLESMSSWLDEVDTGMNSVVNNVHSVDLVLGIKISIEALLDVVHDWSPGLVVVDEITKAWSVDDSQPQAHAVFLNICAY